MSWLQGEAALLIASSERLMRCGSGRVPWPWHHFRGVLRIAILQFTHRMLGFESVVESVQLVEVGTGGCSLMYVWCTCIRDRMGIEDVVLRNSTQGLYYSRSSRHLNTELIFS